MGTDNPEREKRILDAASDLFAHYGYDKTTVSDIARAAGVSKGAIYLHFESKDALFEGLLIREMEQYGQKWVERVMADPDGGSIATMYKQTLYAWTESPFMAAMFKQDRRVFGNYLRKPDNFFRRLEGGRGQSTRHEFIALMQAAGAVRTDISAQVIAHVMNILAYGLVAMDDVIDAEQIPETEALIEGMGLLMEQALAPPGGGNQEAAKQIIEQLVAGVQQQFTALREEESESK
ncbi:MAG TPA: helix-turn-helix domain-containing protein [Anaerolineae bacterium]|nr:helix-turn-helix domain-containing protein [Anaerolineae bacterium]